MGTTPTPRWRITSNRGFEQWGEILGDAMVTAALIDRLVHHATMITLKGKSYLARSARATFDQVLQTITGGAASTLALHGSTEEEQFATGDEEAPTANPISGGKPGVVSVTAMPSLT